LLQPFVAITADPAFPGFQRADVAGDAGVHRRAGRNAGELGRRAQPVFTLGQAGKWERRADAG
jgi:hypothetical protein